MAFYSGSYKSGWNGDLVPVVAAEFTDEGYVEYINRLKREGATEISLIKSENELPMFLKYQAD